MRLMLFLVFTLVQLSSAAIDRDALKDPVLQERYQVITNELRCVVCQNQTIADSHAELAIDLRGQVRAMLLAGDSDDDIRRYMVQRYGDFVLYTPPFAPRTWALWFGPFVLLGIGILVVYRVIRANQRAAANAD